MVLPVLKTYLMERPFEKYSLLLLVTIYAQSAITNKKKKKSFKWLLHQSALARPQTPS